MVFSRKDSPGRIGSMVHRDQCQAALVQQLLWASGWHQQRTDQRPCFQEPPQVHRASGPPDQPGPRKSPCSIYGHLAEGVAGRRLIGHQVEMHQEWGPLHRTGHHASHRARLSRNQWEHFFWDLTAKETGWTPSRLFPRGPLRCRWGEDSCNCLAGHTDDSGVGTWSLARCHKQPNDQAKPMVPSFDAINSGENTCTAISINYGGQVGSVANELGRAENHSIYITKGNNKKQCINPRSCSF